MNHFQACGQLRGSAGSSEGCGKSGKPSLSTYFMQGFNFVRLIYTRIKIDKRKQPAYGEHTFSPLCWGMA